MIHPLNDTVANVGVYRRWHTIFLSAVSFRDTIKGEVVLLGFSVCVDVATLHVCRVCRLLERVE